MRKKYVVIGIVVLIIFLLIIIVMNTLKFSDNKKENEVEEEKYIEIVDEASFLEYIKQNFNDDGITFVTVENEDKNIITIEAYKNDNLVSTYEYDLEREAFIKKNTYSIKVGE